MAKINRYPGNLKAFAADALGTERTIFGDTAQADDLASNITADFLRGWGIVGVNENPTKQDFNGLAYTLGQLIAYLHQMGVSEWHIAQEYAQYGFCIGSNGRLYQSESATNIGNDPTTDAVNWTDVFTAMNIDYDNSISGLVASDVKSAIDELKTLVSDATTTTKGVVELANDTEAQDGTDSTRAIVPSTLRSGLNATGAAPIYACRAWVNFTGAGTVAIHDSGNVSSITDRGVGLYTVNLTTAIEDVNFAVSIMAKATRTNNDTIINEDANVSRTASSVPIALRDETTAADSNTVSMAIFR